MTRIVAALALALLVASPAVAAPPYGAPQGCPARLKTMQAALALSEVKLQEEIERADAQTYLTRLELRVTQQRLAAALAKCGANCAPATPPAVAR